MKRLLFLFALFFLVPFSHAQSFNYHRYTVEDGLPSSQTYDVLQDHNNFIWIASDNGVSRFDGYTFTNFTVEDGLLSRLVFRLYEDHLGRIWFISRIGKLTYYDGKKIVPYQYNSVMDKIAVDKVDVISRLEIEKDGSLLVCCTFSGMFKISPSGQLQMLSKKSNIEKGDLVIAEDHGGKAYAYCVRHTIKDKEYEKSVKGQFGFDFYQEGELKQSVRDRPKDNMLNIYCLRRKNGHVIVASHSYLFDFYKGKVTKAEKFPNIISVYEDRDSCLWLGYYEGGVRRFPPNKSFYESTGRLYFEQKQITKVMEDHEHAFWFTTLHDGILYAPNVNIESLAFNGQANEKFTALEHDRKSRLFVATNHANVYVFTGANLRNHFHLAGRTGNGICKVLFYDTIFSRLYMGTYLDMFVLEKNGKTSILANRAAISLCHDGKGELYAGSYRDLISHYPGNAMMNIKYPHDVLRVDVLSLDQYQTLWIGSPIGLFYYSNSHIEKYSFPEADKSITALASMGRFIYAGTEKGHLLRVDPERTDRAPVSLPVCNGNIYHVEPVSDSTMWISSSLGAYLFNVNTGSVIQHLNRSKGLNSTEVKQIKCLNDTVYALTHEGISFFRSDVIRKNPTPPAVYILGCKIDSVNYIGQNNPQFNYRKNYISFNFVGLSYRSQGQVQYRYRLLGYSSQWETTQLNSVQFSFLDAGDYVFEVVAINEDGVESSSPARFGFTILLPFWRTTWFLVIVVVFILGIVVLAFAIRLRRLKEKNTMLLQINDLRQKALSLQMNPHFVFNSLNSIQSFILSENSYQASKYLSRFAKLIRMGLHHSTVNVVSLEEEIHLLNLYLDLEQMRFRRHFHFRIHVDEKIEAQQLMLPSMLIQPLVENAIKHGVDHEKSDGLILIGFYQENGMLLCRIEDNGKGIKATSKTRQPQEVNVHQSMGMNITKQRIRLFCEKEKHPFHFEVTDKSDFGLGETGTIITFTLPFTRND